MQKRGISIWWALVLVLSIVLSGCSGGYKSLMPEESSPTIGQDSAPRSSEPEFTDGDSERRVISTGSLSLTVVNLDEAEASVRLILFEHDGYIQESYSNAVGGSQYWEFTLRIPSARFEESITRFSALGKVRTIRTSEQDVTEEYLDLDARLRVLLNEEERLLELLKMAVTMDDFLKVEANLSRVRVSIEQTTGKMRFLDNRIDYATLALTIQQEAGTVEPELKGFAGLGKRLGNAFRDGMNLFVDLVAGTLVFAVRALPILPVLALLAYGMIRLFRKLRRKS
ncbi:MAG TPA: DUF4349 domain-containing protein [Bacillota bacterium]|nr:DUF4349 domain-containing protein [Bacillota bacterium]